MKAEIEKAIYEVMRDKMAIDVEKVESTEPLAELADTDDWSFIFVPELERQLGISVPVESWNRAGTVDEVVEMLASVLQAKK